MVLLMAAKRFDDARLSYRDLQTRNYSGYFMLSNPFPSIPVAERDPKVFIDRESIMIEVANVTKDCFNTGNSQTMIMQGNYGNGKSHVLRYIKARINEQLGNQSGKRAVAAYVQSPGGDINYLLSSLIEDLGLDFLQEQALLSLAEFYNNQSDRSKYVIGSKSSTSVNQPRRLEMEVQTLRRDLTPDKILLWSLGNDLARQLSVKFPDFVKAFCRLATEASSGLAWRWLLGERLSRSDKDVLGVTSNIESSDDALNAFTTLKKVLGVSGIAAVYVLLDEFEKVSEIQNVRARARYIDDLRHFIDQNDTGICLIGCITPTGWDYVRGSGHPLARRLLGNVHWLEPFKLSEVERLIEAYVTVARSKYLDEIPNSNTLFTNKTRAVANAELFPFGKAAVSFLHEATKGNISEVLRLCKRLIDLGSDKNYPLLNDPALISQFTGVALAEGAASA